jgi:hypothetical protein
MSCMGIYTCRKVYSNNLCIGYEHFNGPIKWIHDNLLAFSPFAFFTHWQRFTSPFCWWFPFKNTCYFKLGGIFFFALMCSPCFSSGDLSCMVYELLWYCFVPYDFLSDFDFLKVCGHIACGHVPLSILHFLTSLWFLTSWRSKLVTFDPLWLERSFINWLSTHWPFTLRIHLRSILILISLVWWHMASMKEWSIMFVLFWICIQIGWYYMWMFIISSIPYHEQPFFQELQFSISALNYFFVFVQQFYACPSSCYFSHVFWYEDSQSFCPSLVHDKEDLLGGTLFVLPHFCVLCLTATTHPTCVSFIH